MGGGGPKPTAKTGDKAAPKPAAPTHQSVQPFMPGMDNMLAQQLAMGFGGNPNDFMKQFASIYSPMQLPTSPVYLNPKPAAPVPAAGGGNKRADEVDGKKFALGWKQDLYNG